MKFRAFLIFLASYVGSGFLIAHASELLPCLIEKTHEGLGRRDPLDFKFFNFFEKYEENPATLDPLYQSLKELEGKTVWIDYARGDQTSIAGAKLLSVERTTEQASLSDDPRILSHYHLTRSPGDMHEINQIRTLPVINLKILIKSGQTETISLNTRQFPFFLPLNHIALDYPPPEPAKLAHKYENAEPILLPKLDDNHPLNAVPHTVEKHAFSLYMADAVYNHDGEPVDRINQDEKYRNTGYLKKEDGSVDIDPAYYRGLSDFGNQVKQVMAGAAVVDIGGGDPRLSSVVRKLSGQFGSNSYIDVDIATPSKTLSPREQVVQMDFNDFLPQFLEHRKRVDPEAKVPTVFVMNGIEMTRDAVEKTSDWEGHSGFLDHLAENARSGDYVYIGSGNSETTSLLRRGFRIVAESDEVFTRGTANWDRRYENVYLANPETRAMAIGHYYKKHYLMQKI